MFQFRFIVGALVFAFMAHPLGLAGANAGVTAEHVELEMLDMSTEMDMVNEGADHSSSSERYDHNGGACCSTSGVCIAILVENVQTIDVVLIGSTDANLIRSLTARTVDALLHPPKIYS